MYGNPRFSSPDPQIALEELANCAGEYPNSYVKFLRYDNARGTEACTMAFLYDFPEDEKGFKLIRQEEGGRNMRYTLERVP
jgi:ribulose-bisphosphate carboxylase small chain